MIMDLLVQLSSCVPSTDMDTEGARIDAAGLASFRERPSNIGLAEFMIYPGVIHRNPDVLAKLELYDGQHIDWHSLQRRGRDLNA